MREALAAPVVAPATISGYEQGDTKSDVAPHKWMRGAVFSQAGELVGESQRTWSPANANAAVAADPDRYTAGGQATRLDGHWVYLGHWSNHFGHFLVEVLPTLWPPRPADVQGLIAHRSFRLPNPLAHPKGPTKRVELRSWQADMLELAGYQDLPVMVVRSRPVTVERLTVPARPVVFRSRISDEARDLWRRMTVAAGTPTAPGGHIFLSRRTFNRASEAPRSAPQWDDHLEDDFRARGFQVVEPETLTVREQIRLVAGAEVLAGSAGSALHLAAFCNPGTVVVEIGDSRTPNTAQTSQLTVNEACGLRSMFVRYQDPEALSHVLAEVL